MKTIGFDQRLYILPFDHRGSFQTKMFGWHGDLTATQTAEIAAIKHVIYDGFKAAVAAGVEGFIGFAVGRTAFWEPLMSYRRGEITRGAAVAEIARRYEVGVGIFEKAPPRLQLIACTPR